MQVRKLAQYKIHSLACILGVASSAFAAASRPSALLARSWWHCRRISGRMSASADQDCWLTATSTSSTLKLSTGLLSRYLRRSRLLIFYHPGATYLKHVSTQTARLPLAVESAPDPCCLQVVYKSACRYCGPLSCRSS